MIKTILSLFLCLIVLGISIPFISSTSNPDKFPDNYFYVPQNYSLQKCDLNKDGYTDIVVANYARFHGYYSNSFIYWGSSTGYSSSNRIELPTVGVVGVCVADLNKDSWPDIVFANLETGTGVPYETSYIYWGSANGFLESNRTDLPTIGADGVSVSDLNKDGWLDIVFANGTSGSNSYIYWGSSNGYSTTNRSELPTLSTNGVSISDLNKDSWPDIVFANYHNYQTHSYLTDSYIYWGSVNGYSTSNVTKLPTKGATGVDINDLNKDGWIDIVFANFTTGSSNSLNSYVYWGSSNGYNPTNKTELPTSFARGATSADLNRDNYIDVLIPSYIYWGSQEGYSANNRSYLSNINSAMASVCDLNNDTYLDLLFASPYSDIMYIYWGSPTGYSDSNRSQLASIGSGCVTTVMLSYTPSSVPEEQLRPKLEALMKHVRGRMHNIEKLLSEIESKLPAEIPDEIQDKLNQVQELLEEAEESKSPAEANALLNEAKEILDEILNQLK